MLTNTTRGFLWSDVETRTLLKIWGEQDIQTALDGNFRNSFVYRDVARRLLEMGFERTPEQCRVRVKSLKRQYLLAKEGNLRNNGQYHKICKFYDHMERILSSRPQIDPQELMGDETMDGTEEEGEDTDHLPQDGMGYPESTGECSSFPVTQVKLEYPPIPIPVTVGNGTSVRQSSSSQSAVGGPCSSRPKRPRKRHVNLPMDKLMERFLEQSAEAEVSFYHMEEQRLLAEEHRREAEHSRELHMLQVLGQMFTTIAATSTANTVATATAAATEKTPPACVPAAASSSSSSTQPNALSSSSGLLTRGQGGSSHPRVQSSSQADCLNQHSQLSHPGSNRSLGSSFSNHRWRRRKRGGLGERMVLPPPDIAPVRQCLIFTKDLRERLKYAQIH